MDLYGLLMPRSLQSAELNSLAIRGHKCYPQIAPGLSSRSRQFCHYLDVALRRGRQNHPQPRFGGLLPQAATEVIVHNVTQGTDRHEFSGPDGLFLIANLPPGRYSLQAQKIGFAKSALTALELSGGEVCSTVLVLGA